MKKGDRSLLYIVNKHGDTAYHTALENRLLAISQVRGK